MHHKLYISSHSCFMYLISHRKILISWANNKISKLLKYYFIASIYLNENCTWFEKYFVFVQNNEEKNQLAYQHVHKICDAFSNECYRKSKKKETKQNKNQLQHWIFFCKCDQIRSNRGLVIKWFLEQTHGRKKKKPKEEERSNEQAMYWKIHA